ncbi:N-(5'-phosphoribosyl)anthranilate isomerase [Sinobacterium norvegicum]|uniref:N-(5'-phosphoribosyl)anthranilate isomerase n=1 Tax=Sinobacterium norvegicum TaxID=1641715 RepID=A0ABM9ABL3_9GAMM|nr:phosphoribosylanthranilate isomerase [Sinobacterium norvegicum]CAH0990365.1 N-(5'-phosphoribosyl)anthranilate isomerase [Sinobacterium norvegicum]
MLTRIKVCGITQVEDALHAVASGADAIGLVFYADSPRNVTIEQAAVIAQALPPFVTCVGLFVNADASFVDAVLADVKLSCLQFHGDESAVFCQQFNRPWIKAIRMRDDVDLIAASQRYNQAQALLLDAYKKGVPGGTGERFDWHKIPADLASRIVLAGGLNSENVGQAIATAKPYAVDVSGGVEARPGVKDKSKVSEFCRRVNASFTYAE